MYVPKNGNEMGLTWGEILDEAADDPASWVPYRGFDVITRHLWWSAHWQKPEIFREKNMVFKIF